MCAYVQGGCDAGSPMITWLKNDLAANPRRCTLAYFHKPLFSSGYSRGNPVVKPLWNVLYNHHADVIVSGHDHVYERFARQTPSGALDEGASGSSWWARAGRSSEGSTTPPATARCATPTPTGS